jgi:hypothetical protein
MDAETAALDIDMRDYADWGDPERLVLNIAATYRHLDGRPKDKTHMVKGFASMARVAAAMKRRDGVK